MINEQELIKAAKDLRKTILERNIANLEVSIARHRMGKLDERARELDHAVQTASCKLQNLAGEGIPNSWDVCVGGDNQEAHAMIDKMRSQLVDMRVNEKKEEFVSWSADRGFMMPAKTPQISIDIGKIEAKIMKDFMITDRKLVGPDLSTSLGFKKAAEKIVKEIESELLTKPLIPTADDMMTPWDSLTE